MLSLHTTVSLPNPADYKVANASEQGSLVLWACILIVPSTSAGENLGSCLHTISTDLDDISE